MKKFSVVISVFLLGLAAGAAGTIALTGRSFEKAGPKPAAVTPGDSAWQSPAQAPPAGKFANPAYRRRLSGAAKSIPYASRPVEVRAQGFIESVTGPVSARTILFRVETVGDFQAIGGPEGGAPPGAPPIKAGDKLRARVSPAIKTTLERGAYSALFRFAPGSTEPPVALRLERGDG